MSSAAASRPIPNDELVKILETFTPEAEDLVLKNCEQYEFDEDSGPVPLGETLINLRAARDLLLGAAKANHLPQIPLSIQAKLLGQVREIARCISSLNGGTDEVSNLSNSVEQLHVMMWEFRLDNLTPEFLGYQTKLNDLKKLEREIKELRDQLKGGVISRKRLDTIVEESEKLLKQLGELSQQGGSMQSQIETSLEQAKENEQSIASLNKSLIQQDNNMSVLASSAKTAAAEATSKEQKIREFFAEISEYRATIEESVAEQKRVASKWEKDATEAVATNSRQTEELNGKLRAIEGEIREHLQKAVGASLFAAFGKRQETLVAAKDTWFNRLRIAVGLSFILGVLLVTDLTLNGHSITYSPLFFLKLSLTLPLIYVIYFFAGEYKKERQLEEEYAFKANISVSLIAYKDLVDKIIEHENEAERQKYTDFIVHCIERIFESPMQGMEKKGDAGLEPDKLTEKIMQGVVDIAKVVRK